MIGEKKLFTYPAAFLMYPDYRAHSGQLVTVVRQLTDEECEPECQPMYLVRADDGWTGHVDASELT
jgi:hypothetical protein